MSEYSFGYEYSLLGPTKNVANLKYGNYKYYSFNVLKFNRKAAVNDTNFDYSPEVVKKAASGLFFSMPYLDWYTMREPIWLKDTFQGFDASESVESGKYNKNECIVFVYKVGHSTINDIAKSLFAKRSNFSNAMSIFDDDNMAEKIGFGKFSILPVISVSSGNSNKSIVRLNTELAIKHGLTGICNDTDIASKTNGGNGNYFEYDLLFGESDYNRNTVPFNIDIADKYVSFSSSSNSSIFEQIVADSQGYYGFPTTQYENILSSKEIKSATEQYNGSNIWKKRFMSTPGIDVLTPHKIGAETSIYNKDNNSSKYFPNSSLFEDYIMSYGEEKYSNIFENVIASPPNLQRYIIFEKESIARRPIFEGLINDDISNDHSYKVVPLVNYYENINVLKVIPNIYDNGTLFASVPIKIGFYEYIDNTYRMNPSAFNFEIENLFFDRRTLSMYKTETVYKPKYGLDIYEQIIASKDRYAVNRNELIIFNKTLHNVLENIMTNVIMPLRRTHLFSDSVVFSEADQHAHYFVNDLATPIREGVSVYGTNFFDIDSEWIDLYHQEFVEKDNKGIAKYIDDGLLDKSSQDAYCNPKLIQMNKDNLFVSYMYFEKVLSRKEKTFSLLNDMMSFDKYEKTLEYYKTHYPISVSYSNVCYYNALKAFEKADKKYWLFSNSVSFDSISKPLSDTPAGYWFNRSPKYIIYNGKNVFIDNEYKIGQKYNSPIPYSLSAYETYANDKNIFLSAANRNVLSSDDNIFTTSSSIIGRRIFITDSMTVKLSSKDVMTQDNNTFIDKYYHHAFCVEQLFVPKKLHNIYKDTSVYLSYKKYVNAQVSDIHFMVDKIYYDALSEDDNFFVTKVKQKIIKSSNDTWFKRLQYDSHVNDKNYFVLVKEKSVYTYIYSFVLNSRKPIFTTGLNRFMTKPASNVYIDKKNDFITKYFVNMYINSFDSSAIKSNIGIVTHNKIENVDKTLQSLYLQKDNVFSYKTPKSLFMEKAKGIFVDKVKKGTVIDNLYLFIYKIPIGLRVDISEYWSYKDAARLSTYITKRIDDEYLFANKYAHNVAVDINKWVNKDYKDVYVNNNGISLNKGFKHIHLNDKELTGLLKGKIDCTTCDFIESSDYVFVMRYPSDTFVDDINHFVFKGYHDVFITRDTFASRYPTDAFDYSFTLFCDLDKHETFLANESKMVAKVKASIALASITEWITKYKQPITLNTNTWFDKIKKKIDVNKEYIRFRKPKTVVIHDNIYSHPVFAKLTQRDICVHDDLFIKKIPYGTELNYPFWLKKVSGSLLLNNDTDIHRTNVFDAVRYISDVATSIKEVNTNKEVPISTKQRNMSYVSFDDRILRMAYDGTEIQEVCIPIEKIAHNVLFMEAESVYRKYYELNLPVNGFGEFAWSYEYPNPFEKLDASGIDELLLPEKDFIYENFEDIVFNKKLNRPRNPIKKIDDNTWLCRYPTKHPFKNFHEEDGKRYVGVVDDNYFGVRVSIMKDIYIKYYQIWQKNMFKCATMTMVESSKMILEYLYSWIMLYFPHEDIEEALRVFRQIRWYSEASIINNSQYVISGEWEDMKMLDIPNNLEDNDTMFYDPKTVTIRNTKESVKNTEAFVEFYVDTWKDTTFSFSLINTVGSVKVYIDDELVDTISATRRNNIYPLKYTGETITVKIEKDALNNQNDQFMIANVRINGLKFGSLNVDFDPKYKAGNKVLNDVSKKIMQWASMRDDIEEAYNELLKDNISEVVTVNMLSEYFELHHENKTKGKRLTIKKS